jgi:hypothetical protein
VIEVSVAALGVVTIAPLAPVKVTEVAVARLSPEMVTVFPTKPASGERVVMLGASTVKLVVLTPVVSPVTSTEIEPVVAPVGTFTTMLVPPVTTGDEATTPLNFTVGLLPKLVPVIVTASPTFPDAGENELTTGDVAVTADGVTSAQVVPTLIASIRPVGAAVKEPCRTKTKPKEETSAIVDPVVRLAAPSVPPNAGPTKRATVSSAVVDRKEYFRTTRYVELKSLTVVS